MIGIILTDPCYYCGLSLKKVAKDGCGSKEFPKSAVDKWCYVLPYARQNDDVEDRVGSR